MTDAISRRLLLKGLAALGGGLALPRRARGESPSAGPVRLGLVVPKGTPAAAQARMGARAGLDDGNTFANFFGRSLALLVEEASAADEVARKGTLLVRKGRAVALIGGVDDASARALRDVAAREPAVFLNIGGRADELRGAACHGRLFHVCASDAMYADVLVQWLADRKKTKQWAILGGDTPRGRALSERAAAAIGRAGGRVTRSQAVPPGDTTGAVPDLAKRAADSGAEVIFLAMEGPEQMAAIRAAKTAGVATPLAGPALDPGDFLSRDLIGVRGFWSSLWYHEMTRFSARELNRRFREEHGNAPMEGQAWAGWAAVRLAAEAAVRAEEPTAAVWAEFLAGDFPFDGHKGEQLTFRPWDHQLRLTFGILSPVAPGESKATEDVYGLLADNAPRELDSVGIDRDATRCRFGA